VSCLTDGLKVIEVPEVSPASGGMPDEKEYIPAESCFFKSLQDAQENFNIVLTVIECKIYSSKIQGGEYP